MSEDGKNVFLFEHLVFDIQYYIIAYFVSPQDLHSLALVSKLIHTVATPALYRHVRMLPGLTFRFTSPQLSRVYTKSLSLAQKTFAKQVASSDKADNVRFLEWHMFSHGVPPREVFLEVFPKLQKLQKLHLINAHPTNMEDRYLPIPISPLLFPHLAEIKISGITHLPFLLPILHTPRRLRSITIDALEPHFGHLQLLQWLTTENFENLQRLALWVSLSIERFKIDQIINAWGDVLHATRHSVEEVTLGFRLPLSSRAATGRSCSEEDRQMFSLQLLHSLRSVFSARKEWRYLKKLNLMGVSFPPGEDVRSIQAQLQHLPPPAVVVISNLK